MTEEVWKEDGPQGHPLWVLAGGASGQGVRAPAIADLAGPVPAQLEALGPRAQLPGSHNPTTNLQAKPPLDQGSFYAEL